MDVSSFSVKKNWDFGGLLMTEEWYRLVTTCPRCDQRVGYSYPSFDLTPPTMVRLSPHSCPHRGDSLVLDAETGDVVFDPNLIGPVRRPLIG